uniref:Alpha/beta hydrolase domain-containing protein 17C n=1 Tax=Suricata suricatta TaxID=37032 RepID=A0A673TGP0_SURSU
MNLSEILVTGLLVWRLLRLLFLMKNFKENTMTKCGTAFVIDKISKVTSPVLVIHGTEDEVIDFSHGLAMYERCPRAVEPLWVEGAGHNDIELYAQYLDRLRQFISHELPNS